MTIETTLFGSKKYRTEKLRVILISGTIRLYIFEVTTDATAKAAAVAAGLKGAPIDDDPFTWEKFYTACGSALRVDVETTLKKYGTLTETDWANSISPNTAKYMAASSGPHVKVEKIKVDDKLLGPVDYFVIIPAV